MIEHLLDDTTCQNLETVQMTQTLENYNVSNDHEAEVTLTTSNTNPVPLLMEIVLCIGQT